MQILAEQKQHVVLTADDARSLDERAMDLGISGYELMQNAGKAVAEMLAYYIGTPLEAPQPIIILCGPGNNGGDGFVAAQFLKEWGYLVSLRCSVGIDTLTGDAGTAAEEWDGSVDAFDTKNFGDSAAIVDCLFGVGLNKPIEGDVAEIITEVNAADTFVLSVDIASGLDANTGQPNGDCIKADATITFNFKKPAHLIAPGRFLSGGSDNIHVAAIGVPIAAIVDLETNISENLPSLWGRAFPFSGPQTHKYDRGHMLVLGGREPTLGASRLASIAGLRTGAGLVTLAAPTETYAVQASALMDVMVRRFDSSFGFMGIVNDPRIRAVLIGPGSGLGEKTVELIQHVGAKDKKLVLDADALTSLVGRTDLISKLKAGEVVLTPHEGEFAKLFPTIEVNEDRIQAAREAAKATRATIVLKGVSTIVAAPDGRVSIATNAPAWLSIGGTGDVLSGIICGLMTQGMPAFEAASAGVWIHGEAGMRAGRGLIASDLLDVIPKVLP